MGNGAIAYRGMGYRGYKATWAMGHRGYGTHQQWGMGHMGNQVQGYGAHGQWGTGVWAP